MDRKTRCQHCFCTFTPVDSKKHCKKCCAALSKPKEKAYFDAAKWDQKVAHFEEKYADHLKTLEVKIEVENILKNSAEPVTHIRRHPVENPTLLFRSLNSMAAAIKHSKATLPSKKVKLKTKKKNFNDLDAVYDHGDGGCDYSLPVPYLCPKSPKKRQPSSKYLAWAMSPPTDCVEATSWNTVESCSDLVCQMDANGQFSIVCRPPSHMLSYPVALVNTPTVATDIIMKNFPAEYPNKVTVVFQLKVSPYPKCADPVADTEGRKTVQFPESVSKHGNGKLRTSSGHGKLDTVRKEEPREFSFGFAKKKNRHNHPFMLSASGTRGFGYSSHCDSWGFTCPLAPPVKQDASVAVVEGPDSSSVCMIEPWEAPELSIPIPLVPPIPSRVASRIGSRAASISHDISHETFSPIRLTKDPMTTDEMKESQQGKVMHRGKCLYTVGSEESGLSCQLQHDDFFCVSIDLDNAAAMLSIKRPTSYVPFTDQDWTLLLEKEKEKKKKKCVPGPNRHRQGSKSVRNPLTSRPHKQRVGTMLSTKQSATIKSIVMTEKEVPLVAAKEVFKTPEVPQDPLSYCVDLALSNIQSVGDLVIGCTIPLGYDVRVIYDTTKLPKKPMSDIEKLIDRDQAVVLHEDAHVTNCVNNIVDQMKGSSMLWDRPSRQTFYRRDRYRRTPVVATHGGQWMSGWVGVIPADAFPTGLVLTGTQSVPIYTIRIPKDMLLFDLDARIVSDGWSESTQHYVTSCYVSSSVKTDHVRYLCQHLNSGEHHHTHSDFCIRCSSHLEIALGGLPCEYLRYPMRDGDPAAARTSSNRYAWATHTQLAPYDECIHGGPSTPKIQLPINIIVGAYGPIAHQIQCIVRVHYKHNVYVGRIDAIPLPSPPYVFSVPDNLVRENALEVDDDRYVVGFVNDVPCRVTYIVFDEDHHLIPFMYPSVVRDAKVLSGSEDVNEVNIFKGDETDPQFSTVVEYLVDTTHH